MVLPISIYATCTYMQKLSGKYCGMPIGSDAALFVFMLIQPGAVSDSWSQNFQYMFRWQPFLPFIFSQRQTFPRLMPLLCADRGFILQSVNCENMKLC